MGFWTTLHTKHARPTYTRTPIVHVRKTRPAYIHSDPNCPCTKKHTWPTYTRTPIVHVRKTRPAYIHSDPNCPCTKNTPGLHTLEPHVHVRKTRPAYIHSNPNCPCTQNTPGLHTLGPQSSTIGTRFWATLHAKHARPTYTRTPIFHHRRSLHGEHTWPTYPRTPIAHVQKCGSVSVSVSIVHVQKHARPTFTLAHFLPGLPLFLLPLAIPGHRYGRYTHTTIATHTTIDKCNPL